MIVGLVKCLNYAFSSGNDKNPILVFPISFIFFFIDFVRKFYLFIVFFTRSEKNHLIIDINQTYFFL